MMKLVANRVAAGCSNAKSASCDLKIARGACELQKAFYNVTCRFDCSLHPLLLSHIFQNEVQSMSATTLVVKLRVFSIKIRPHNFILLALSVQICTTNSGPILSLMFDISVAIHSPVFSFPDASMLPSNISPFGTHSHEIDERMIFDIGPTI